MIICTSNNQSHSFPEELNIKKIIMLENCKNNDSSWFGLFFSGCKSLLLAEEN